MRSVGSLLLLLLLVVLFPGTAAASGNPPCQLNPVGPSVTICTPTDGSSVASPFEVWAGTTSATPVVAMKVYLDGIAVYRVDYFQIEGALITAAPGPHKVTVRAWDSAGATFASTVYINVGEGTGTPGECAPVKNPGITICSPASGSTTASPVRILATAASSKQISSMKAYIDGTGSQSVAGSTLDLSVAAANGSHKLTVKAWHTDGTSLTETIFFNVGSGGSGTAPCPASSSSPPSVTICEPLDGATVTSPLRVTAAANDTSTVTGLKLYVDGTSVHSASGNTLDTSVPLTGGSHKLTVRAWNASGATYAKTVFVNVGSGGGGTVNCTAPATGPAINICSPAAGSTVASPVRLTGVGTDVAPIVRMEAWRNGSKIYEVAGNTLDTSVTLANGSHLVTFVMVNNAGGVTKKDVSFTVGEPSGGGGTTPGTITVTPRVSVVTDTTQQFTANTSVTWLVDGIEGGNNSVGTISATGLYTPPAGQGTFEIRAVSTADATKYGVAKVHVSKHSGVYTYHYDNARLGANTEEFILGHASVNSTQFGKLCQYSIDAYSFTQPLYVPNVDVPGKGLRNIVFVGTGKDTLYAFDADCRSTTPLWSRTFTNAAAGITPIPYQDAQSSNNGPEIGITGTPVIDRDSRTIYFVTAVKDNGTYRQHLRALDIATGSEKFGSPVAITASVVGTGDNRDAQGRVQWSALRQNQRPGLLLHQGLVYIGWGSHHVIDPWHGWFVAYRANNLQEQVSVFNTTPDRRHGGIWMGGAAPATDGTDIFLVSGQGTFTAHQGGRDYGDSALRLTTSLTVKDYFTPYNQQMLNEYDLDFGASGITILPPQSGTATPNLAVVGSKEGHVYLLDRDALGGYNPAGDTQIVQKISNAAGALRGAPTVWRNYVYFAGALDVLKAFQLNNGRLTGTPVSAATRKLDSRGAMPIVSSNGDANGIVWIAERVPNAPGILRAYDATDLTRELWNSTMNSTRDTLGYGQKFSVPTVVNGRVYVVTLSRLIVYGPLQ